MAKINISQENLRNFVDEFIDEYLLLEFGKMPKDEINVLVFKLLHKYGYNDSDDYYSIANDLRIEERAVRNYVRKVFLKEQHGDTTRQSMKSLQKKIFIDKKIALEINKNEKTLSFMIPNPNEQMDFCRALESVGYTVTSTFNPKKIEVPIYAFTAAFWRYDDDLYKNFKTLVNETYKTEKEREKPFDKGIPLSERVMDLMRTADTVGSAVGTVCGAVATLPELAKFIGIE